MNLNSINVPDRSHQGLVQYLNAEVFHLDSPSDLYGRYYQIFKGGHLSSFKHLLTCALLDY